MINPQIKTFLQVVERGSLSKAAEDLFVTPASVMKQMNALEERLGLRLLERTNQGVALTTAGQTIYNAAKELITAADEAVITAKEIQQRPVVKTIRVGSSFLNPGGVLIGLWNQITAGAGEYRIKLIPYDDDRDHILSVVASLGTKLDFMVGVFGSQQMLSMADFYELGRYRMCIAVPRTHRLAGKSKLKISDMYGEHLITVKSGDSPGMAKFKEMLKMTHPQILLEDTHYFYDLETFNTCEMTGSLLLTLDGWADIHPSLVTLPVEWDFTVPYGLLFSKELSEDAMDFLNLIKEYMR